jgi:uncharacterized protein
MIVKAGTTPPNADGIAAAASAASRKGPPPVHLWNPDFCGDIDMEIRRDGSWFYMGTPIGRPALVRLFASILKREGDDYFLVTPVEKVGIRVQDCPFLAQDVAATGSGAAQELRFTTNVGDEVLAGAENPIEVSRDPETGEPAPKVHIRRDLWARIDRKTFYRLIDIAVTAPHEGADWLGLWSGGTFFPIIPAADLT